MSFSKKHYIEWLQSQVKQSITDDIGSALDCFYKSGCGFFAIPRMLFPEIDGLGAYLTGNNTDKGTTKNIVVYLREVMSQVDPRYGEYAVFITYIFRHGLLHQHDPKKFKFGKKKIGWEFSVNSGNCPNSVSRKHHLVWDRNNLRVDMNLFYQDVVNSIEKFVGMIENREVDFNKVRAVYYAQHRPLLRKNILRKGKNFVTNSDFKFLSKKPL